MHRSYVLKQLFATLFTVVFLCSCGVNTADSSEITNLFQYALEIEDGVFAPKQVDFFMSIEEILQATGLNEDAVLEQDGIKTIRADANIDGFPYDVQAMYVFDEGIGNLLVTVRYLILVDKAETADIYNLLYEQAISTMPEVSGNTMEGIKDGIGVSWEDKIHNYVELSIGKAYSSGDDDSIIINLSINVTQNAEPFIKAYGNVMEAQIIEIFSYGTEAEMSNRGSLRVSSENSIYVINIQQDTIIQDINGKQLDFTELKEGQSIWAVTHPRVLQGDSPIDTEGNITSEGEDIFWLCYEITVL